MVFFIVAAPGVLRALGWYHSIDESHVRWDECSIGVLLAAVSVFMPVLWTALCRVAPFAAGVAALSYAFSFWCRWHPQYGIGDYGTLTYALIFGTFVLLATSSDAWKRRLHLPGCSYLAARAYSIYLLHPESLALLHRLPVRSFPVFLALTWVITLAGAELLFRLIERPAMRARESFGFSKSMKSSRPVAVLSKETLLASV
jgi:peptidoglycan/LPS O-acetylase OafA/YrhL